MNMKDTKELLIRIIHNEEKYIESVRHTLKEDELTILRLKNKAKALEAEIKERKQLVEEYRTYLKEIPENANSEMKLMPLLNNKRNLQFSNFKIGMINI